MSLFDEHKAAEAAAYLLAQAGGAMAHHRLSCLLYLSERASYERYGVPLTGDVLLAIDSGPVLSRVHSFITGRTPDALVPALSSWLMRGPRSGFEIRSRKDWRDADKRLSHLSDADLGILSEIWSRFGSVGRVELAEYTKLHCPEWSDPYGSAKLIHPTSLLRYLGYSAQVAEEIYSSMVEQAQVNQALAA